MRRPDLQELVAKFGSYSAIPAETWAKWDQADTAGLPSKTNPAAAPG
jgi:hypothetical protein